MSEKEDKLEKNQKVEEPVQKKTVETNTMTKVDNPDASSPPAKEQTVSVKKEVAPEDINKNKITEKTKDENTQVKQKKESKEVLSKKKLTSADDLNKNNLNTEKRNNPLDNSNKPQDKLQNDYIEKLVSINRVAKVVKGGRRFSFAALVVVGDGNGMVGHGKGKAKEVPEAIKKATDEAKNTMIRVPLRQGRTLHHDIKGRFDSGNVYLRSAPSGTGVIAGGPMRAVFEALGIQDIVAKSIGSSNPHNMVRATFEALKVVSSPKIIASRRGLKINDITKRRKNATAVENAKT